MRAGTKALFTVEEANRVLPLVRSIVADLVAEFRDLRAGGRERRALEVETSADPRAVRRIAELEEHVRDSSARVEGYLRELAELGVEVRDLELGLVDFPTLMGSEPAYLCWREGEAAVGHWHHADAGFADREPLDARAGAPADLPAPPRRP